ncbi:MAG: FGGY-family carbohydrate kinase [Deltaproteobacteria bacterium]|nr:FGGY-family carbohydrate kinase [Deltaproteobacteria bacterium]
MDRSAADNRYVLAIDHGTSGCKTALVSVNGRVGETAFEPTPIHYLPGGGAEQDPEDWWRTLVATAARVVSASGLDPDHIVGMCCSSTFSSTVAADREGRPLMNALTWLDSRGAPHVRRLMKGLVNIEGYGLSNLLNWVPRTGGGPTLSGKDDIAHVLYVQNERPDVYRETHRFVGSKDWLNWRLTGRCAASFDSVTLFWVTDNRDIDNVRYHDGLIRRLGVDRAKLPRLMRSTDVLGPVMPAVADAIGLRRDTPVIVGAADLQSACVGSGAVGDFDGHVYIGTSSWVLCHVPFKKTDVFHKVASLPSAIPGRYFCANEQDMAGGCLEFVAKNLLYHRNRLRDEAPPEDVYAQLDEVAREVPPGSRGVLFTPWLNGEKTPVDNETLRGGWHNLSVNNNLDDMVRAVFEGVALNTRWNLKYVERFTGRAMNPLNIIGGGARSDVWCRIMADVLGRTVRQVEDPLQANARGAAFIAAVALGHIGFDDIPGLIRFSDTFDPDPANRGLYDNLFGEFLNIYRLNRGLYARLNR